MLPVSLRWLLPALPLLSVLTHCTPSLQRADKAVLPASATKVYVVRHAEKDLTPGLADPPLTPAGQQRALALNQALAPEQVAAVFSTATARTRATAAPLAARQNQPVQPYDARQLSALAARLRRDYRGRTVLVVGHSNTILETVDALGAPRPVPVIGDDTYDYLLEVSIPADSTRPATATARRYGAPTRP
ncbi:histidine phosphatase family protein [Hymenobacter sp. NST-14]|uniref:histidine phosphatase family protein n=1 Tax=Hymenobacter piscis TaxID=2839984 RepID=UPI001C009E6C|nr:histidine phosphatase family protein [Hymenobacter piscis]MBT9392463.1 histidine phosphatase family protein [Hymenobacter piscis]